MIRSLSVVIPARNEAGRLPRSLARIHAHLAPRVAELELLVVDDGSSDGTAELARAAAPGLRVERHDHSRGKGAAVRTGVLAARGEWILVSDADLAIPIEEFESLERESSAAAIVVGAKTKAQERPLLRRWSGAVGQQIVRFALVGGFSDTQCGFKLFRRDVATKLFALQTLRGFGCDFEILYLARKYGIACREVPVRCDDPGGGSVRWTSYLATLRELGSVVLRKLLGRYPRGLED